MTELFHDPRMSRGKALYTILYVRQEKTQINLHRPTRVQCPPEDALDLRLPTESPAKTLVRLRGFTGWSESSMKAHVVLYRKCCAPAHVVFILNKRCNVNNIKQ